MNDYIDQYKIFYENGGYGNNDPVVAAKDMIKQLIKETKSQTLLDYGCGHGLQYSEHKLHDYWKIKEENLCKYDPAISKFSNLPSKKFDAVINTDVMEHIPIKHVDKTIEDIFEHATKLVYFRIATGPAKALLPNGENAHCTLLTHEKWLKKILPHRSDQKVVVETTASKNCGPAITYHV